MGEEMKFGAGMLYLDSKPVMSIQEVPEFVDTVDPEEENKEAFSLKMPEITGNLVIPTYYWPKTRKILAGFDRCKGPGRYKAIAKCLKYMQKAYRVDEKYLRMFVELGYIPVNEELSCPVDLYGLPCTDIWEYLWFRMAVVEDAAEYMDYKCEKIKRTIRSKHRQRR